MSDQDESTHTRNLRPRNKKNKQEVTPVKNDQQHGKGRYNKEEKGTYVDELTDDETENEEQSVLQNSEEEEEQEQQFDTDHSPRKSASPNKQNKDEEDLNTTKSLNKPPQYNKKKNDENNSKIQVSPVAIAFAIPVLVAIIYGVFYPNESKPSIDMDWRSKIDPENHLSNELQSTIRASLKPILDKPSTRQDESISTLLILSSNEDTAAQVARCILTLVNKQSIVDQKSTEINLQSYSGSKSDLDSNLRSILDSTNSAKAVLLRDINHIPVEHLLERLRLLFGYCDGENPVITNRLYLLTAKSRSENNLREYFKSQLPNEHDFVDALMSRISGHTIYIDNNQTSIC